MAIFPRFSSAGNGPADGPLQNGGRPAVVSFELEQNRSGLWVASQIVLRMVRPLGADGLAPAENSGIETMQFLCVLTC